VTPLRISIITPCLNRRDMVAEAIESVLAQDYPDFEHIVVDGGSTDGTLEVLARYPHLQVVSGPDKGLYDAINKGIRMAKGDVVGLLNTDDIFAPGALHKVLDAFAADRAIDTVSGGAEIFEDTPQGRMIQHHFPGHSHGPLTLERITGGAVIFNARFFRRAVFERVGPFDQGYPVAADRDFLLRVYRSGVREAIVGDIVYCYRQHPGSLTIQASNPRALDLFDELMVLSGRVLDETDVPAAVCRACRGWHDRLAGAALIYAVRTGQIGRGVHFAVRGTTRNPAWPVRFLGQLAGAISRRIGGNPNGG